MGGCSVQRFCQDPGKRAAGRSDNEELLQETFQSGSKCEADGSNLVRPEVRKYVSAWVGYHSPTWRPRSTTCAERGWGRSSASDVHTPAFTWPWEEGSTPNFSFPLHLSKPKDTLLSTQQTALRHLSNVQSTAKKLAWWYWSRWNLSSRLISLWWWEHFK